MECTECGQRNPPSFSTCCHCSAVLPDNEKEKGVIDGLVDLNSSLGGKRKSKEGGGASASFGSSAMYKRVDPVGSLYFVGIFIIASFIVGQFSACGCLDISVADMIRQ